MSSDTPFHIFTSLRCDPLLAEILENRPSTLNPIAPAPSPFYMFLYHRDRLLEAAQHFDFSAAIPKLLDGKQLHKDLLQEVERYLENGGTEGPLKVRVLFDKQGNMSAEFVPVAPVPVESLFPATLDPPKSIQAKHPAQLAHAESKEFKPSPLTGGALHLGPTDTLPSASSTPPTESPKAEPIPWTLRLDTEPTPSSPFTLLKTTVRDLYNSSRSRALPASPAAPKNVEVMLHNECGEMTEGSITSLYFFRGGRWVTPPVGVPSGDFDAATLRGGEEGEGKENEGDGERWDEGEMRKPFAGRWGHSVRSAKVGAGGQRGTTRRWALAMGMCMEEPVGVDTVQVGETVWVSNGVVGFGRGKVVG